MKTKIPQLILATLFTAGTAQAAAIAWGSATTVSTVSDISTSGSLVEAINLNDGTAGSVTANGVTFANDGSLLSSSSSLDLYSGTTGDAGYDQILSNFDFGNGGGLTTLTLGGGNLVPGATYQIQIWWSDTRQSADRSFRYGDGDGGGVGNFVDLQGQDNLGGPQYSIGTFTADGANQNLVLDPAAYGWGNSHFSAYQIRQVPEPSSTALLGLGLSSLLLRRRRS